MQIANWQISDFLEFGNFGTILNRSKMETEESVMDSLEDLKILSGLTRTTLTEILSDWTSYSQLLGKISKELKVLSKLDEEISPLDKNEDPSSCLMEISCLLSELGCPYSVITEGHINSRFETNEKRLMVLNFLLSELQASQMIFYSNSKQPQTGVGNMEIKLEESKQAKLLREILQSLEFSKPPAGIDISSLCSKIQERTGTIQGKLKANGLDGKALFRGTLTENHWHQLEKFNKELYSEYKLRREMLLKRLDVTVQSFQWSSNPKTDKVRDRNKAISEVYQQNRAKLEPKPQVSLSDLLAAREDLVYFEKTSSGVTRENTKSDVNKVMIGKVPDRGGRPSEAQAPPPEMPAWTQRQGGQGGSSGSVGWTPRGGGARGRGGGGQNQQGNWGGGNRGGYREAQGGGGGHGDRQGGGEYGGGGYQGGHGGYRGGQGGGGGYRGGQGQGGGGGYYDHQGGGYSDQDSYNRGRGNRGSFDDRGGRRPPRVQSGWYSNK